MKPIQLLSCGRRTQPLASGRRRSRCYCQKSLLPCEILWSLHLSTIQWWWQTGRKHKSRLFSRRWHRMCGVQSCGWKAIKAGLVFYRVSEPDGDTVILSSRHSSLSEVNGELGTVEGGGALLISQWEHLHNYRSKKRWKNCIVQKDQELY